MSDLFFNKIAAAGLAAALGFIGINKLANVAVHAETQSPPAYSVYVADESHSPVEVEAPFPQIEWIEGIDAVKGAKVFKKCTSCHNANEGGKNGTGPALWNVVGRAAGTGSDFNYSPAMAGSGITWSYEELDGYLANPKTYIPKNKMAFIGVKKAADRAAVIEYLRLASNSPIVALSEAAPIPGMGGDGEGGHVDEAHIEDAALETVPEGTGLEELSVAQDTPATEIPAQELPVMDKIEDAEDLVNKEAIPEDMIKEAIEEKAEEITDAVPTPEE